MPSVLNTRLAVLEIQESGVGTGARYILDVASGNPVKMTGYTKDYGSVSRDSFIDPSSRHYRPRPAKRALPESPTFQLSFNAQARNWIEKHLDADSRAALYVRFVEAGDPALPTNYARIHALVDCAMDGKEYGDLVEDGDSEEAYVRITVNMNAADEAVILPVAGSTVAHGLTDAADCAATCIATDSDGNLYVGTKADGTGTHPFVLKRTKKTGAWSETEDTGLTADISAIAVAGEYVLWASGTTLTRAHRESLGTTTTYTASGTISGIYAIDAARVVLVGASGMVALSEDGGLTFTVLTSGSVATLSSFAARSVNHWYLGGDSGTLLEYDDGVFTTITPPAALAAGTVNAIALPFSAPGYAREPLVMIAGSNGKAYKTLNDGAIAADDWTEISHALSSAGSVADVDLAGFEGQCLFLLHAAAGGETTVMRDFAGGAGGTNNVETVITADSESLAALLAVDVNTAWAVGDDGSGNLRIRYIEA
jgi:hypothetical protein